jgi:hypothetical protein
MEGDAIETRRIRAQFGPISPPYALRSSFRFGTTIPDRHMCVHEDP